MVQRNYRDVTSQGEQQEVWDGDIDSWREREREREKRVGEK